MKRVNKKALYESIMTSVAKEVKKALNENTLNTPGLRWDGHTFVQWTGDAICYVDDWYIIDYSVFKYFLLLPDDYEVQSIIRRYWRNDDNLEFIQDIYDLYKYSGYIGVLSDNTETLENIIDDLCTETRRPHEMPDEESIVKLQAGKPQIIF